MMNTGYFITEDFRRPEACQAGVDEKINTPHTRAADDSAFIVPFQKQTSYTFGKGTDCIPRDVTKFQG